MINTPLIVVVALTLFDPDLPPLPELYIFLPSSFSVPSIPLFCVLPLSIFVKLNCNTFLYPYIAALFPLIHSPYFFHFFF